MVTLLPPAGATINGDTWSAVEGRQVVLRAVVTSNDALANVGVIVAGVLVLVTGSAIPDRVVGTGVALLVLSGAVRILRL